MAQKHKSVLLPRMEKKPPFSFEVPGFDKIAGETIPRRNVRCKSGLITRPDPAVNTAYDIISYAAHKFGNAKCIGFRTVVKKHKEKTRIKKFQAGQETEVEKEWSYSELSPYEFVSFLEFQHLVNTLGSGLRKIGLGPGDKIHLYGATSMNWLSMAHGAFTQSCVVVTAYDTLGVEGLRWSLQQTKPKAIFVDPNLLPILNVVLKDATTIACVILNSMSNENQDDIYKLLCEFPHTQIISYTEFKELGMDNPAGHVAPTPDDLACIMYTSGTSDMPKGVTIKHRAIVASVAGATSIVGEYIGPDDRLLAYLPQAHIIEFIFENASLFWGATIGFGSPRTLTESSVRNCKGDLLEFCPTILVGVPAVWESIRKSIVGRVNESGLFARTLFWAAMIAKETLLGAKFPMPKVLDALVFDKVRAATGGRLRICMSGGGPLSRDTQQYISTTICPLIIGYGLTETAGMGALNDPRALTFNAHGDIPASVEEKLIDFPEAGYFTSNDPPQGELCIRGPSVTTGYYENDQETKLVLGEDGWFKTGDIAEFDKHGHVKIIDRKKNLIKTLNGEYIALERLEALYSMSPLVTNICIHAAEDRSRPIAIIVPVEATLLKLANENGIQDCDFEALIDSGRLDSIILKEIQRTGRQGQLASFEIVEGIVLDKDEWTPKNGYVTATQKIIRKKILEKNKKAVDKAYGKH